MNTIEAKLYVGCSLTEAPEKFVEDVELLKGRLRYMGHQVFDFVGLTAGTDVDVYQWDLGHCVPDCDLFVAVCDYGASGLGWELCKAVEVLQKPTLAVAHRASRVTRVITGAAALFPNFTFRQYNDLSKDVPRFIQEHLSES